MYACVYNACIHVGANKYALTHPHTWYVYADLAIAKSACANEYFGVSETCFTEHGGTHESEVS
jgi:hypothetical protein